MATTVHLPGVRYLRNGEVEIQDQTLRVPMSDQRTTNASHSIYPTRMITSWRSDDPLSGYQQPLMDTVSQIPYQNYRPVQVTTQAQTNYHLHSQQTMLYGQHSPYFPSGELQEREVQQIQYQHMQHVQMQQQLYQEQQKEKKVDQSQTIQDIAHRKTPSRKRRRPPHSYASLIAQAILTSRNQKLSLRDIYDWIQAKYPHLYEANETGWQNTIRHNLSLNRCFRKVPRLAQDPLIRGKGSKGGFWAVDMDQLSKTTFGRQILDSGMLNTVWSIHNVHQPMDDFDFQGLVSPLYHSAMETTRSSAYSELLDQERASTAVFLARLSQPLSALSTPSFQQNEGSVTSDSTKTYSLRDVSPESPAAIQTPLLSSMRLHEHKLDLESNDPLLLNPSLMRVNNILN